MFVRVIKWVLVTVALFLLVGQTLNKELQIKQSATINASSQFIHKFVNDLRQWPNWAPWYRKNIKIRYGNITSGIGATQSWKSDRIDGRLKITASSISNGIAYDVFFYDAKIPFICSIEYHPENSEQTRVDWRLHGEIDVPIVGGYIALFVRYRISRMYQAGLVKLKNHVEKLSEKEK